MNKQGGFTTESYLNSEKSHKSHSSHSADNTVGLGFHQIENFKKNSVNVDYRTLGWGMTFIHESYHTKMGGNLSDNTSNDRRGDVGRANSDHIDAYVATPNGSLQKYEHKTGRISTISTSLPSDVKDPARLNKVSSKETKPLTIAEQFKVISNYLKLNLNFLQHE